MKNSTICIVFILSVLVFSNCKNTGYDIITVRIDSIDTSGVFFSYNYNDSLYQNCLPLDISEKIFFAHDSIKIKVDKTNPETFYFIDIVKTQWDDDIDVLIIDRHVANLKIYGYHQVEKKPVILGAKNEFENDSIINHLLYNDLKDNNRSTKIGTYILIDGMGKVKYHTAYYQDENQLKEILELVGALPDFSPAMHNGDTVTVSFLIEVPVQNKN